MNKTGHANFDTRVALLRFDHGDALDTRGIAVQFIPFFERRVEVRSLDGQVERGIVLMSKGPKPVLMLAKRANSRQATRTLVASDQVIAVETTSGHYRRLEGARA